MTPRQSLIRLVRGTAARIPMLRQIKEHPFVAKTWARVSTTPVPPAGYDRFLEARLDLRRRRQSVRQQTGLLSFVTTVWNTDPDFIRELADSVLNQDGGTQFEWLVLDNGSTNPGTVARLAELAASPCVRLVRVEENLGIISGMRWCLENASGRYILPLDSDDVLQPDCVNVITQHIIECGFPQCLYTDEDKLRDGVPCDPYFKPDWDPLLFAHSCYIAHLCAIDRLLALELGAYTDPRAEGCHDWDTFTRFALAGVTPSHVPEILYSWRMHPASTAQNIDSKPYVYDSQKSIVERWARAPSVDAEYRVELSPLFNGGPDWRIRRSSASPRPLISVTLSESVNTPSPDLELAGYPLTASVARPRATPLSALDDIAAAAARDKALVHLVWDQLRIRPFDWAWEALTLMELWPDTVMVGGRIFGPRGQLVAGAGVLVAGRGADCPDIGRYETDPGYFAQMWKPHSADVVSCQHAVIDGAFLLDAVAALEGQPVSLPMLGQWLGAVARKAGKRVAYSPFLTGDVPSDWEENVQETERAAFLRYAIPLLSDSRLMSPRLGLTDATYWQPVSDIQRQRHLAALRRRR